MDSLTGIDFGSKIGKQIKEEGSSRADSLVSDSAFILSFFSDLLLWGIAQFFAIIDAFLVLLVAIEKMFLQFRNLIFTNLFWGRSRSRFAFLQSLFAVFGLMGLLFGFITGVYSYTEKINRYLSVKQGMVYAAEKREIDTVIASVSLETLVQTKGYMYDTKYYVVKPGDTLSTIAQKFNISVDTIKWANNLHNDFIRVGQKLKIPPGSGVLHKVKKGETIASIAKKYKAAPQAIMEANFLDSDQDLKAGMEIFVPNGTLPAPPKPKYIASKPKQSYTVPKYVKPSTSHPTLPSGNKFLIWPVAGGGTLTQRYWYRHKAIDIANNAYTWKKYGGHPYILAAASGRVSFAGYVCNAYRCGYAYMIEIQHPNGYSTLYAHLQPGSIRVKKGQWVKQGQIIARMGESGWAYGIHVHFEVAIGHYPYRRRLLNPLYYIK